ncbi:Uncharacterised protein (plasmid) [Legionella adelaidensis]|uniref:Chromosome partition protein Smc n=1 Tax=Legionella adelaidensis TaxID=45056 RepID=A0A0W0R5N1_9GAMM|nr:hypothetical protein [Legionella adelaidensis]KTC66341.1 Chromosome partition protein Smc [Legionella adelaidensis]VEH84939.1 Uncharacterised protein [Legionella adelaidensis]
MPLPLLLGAALVATGKASSVSVAYYIGGGVLAGAGLTGGLWYYVSSNDNRLLQEHMEALNAQHEITNNRIALANNTLDLLCQNVARLKSEINSATGSNALSIEQLQEITEQLSDTSQLLQRTIGTVAYSSSNLDRSVIELKAVTEQIQSMDYCSQSKLAAFNENLAQKEKELAQTALEIKTLNKIVGEQAQTIDKLTDVVETLTNDNKAKEQTIEEKQKAIDQIKAKSLKLVDQLRFFKQVIDQQSAPASTAVISQTSSSPFN